METNKWIFKNTGIVLSFVCVLLTFSNCNKQEEGEEFVMTPPAEPFLTYVPGVLRGDTNVFEDMWFYYEDDDRFLPFALLMCHHYKYVHAYCAVFKAKTSYCYRHGISVEPVIKDYMRYLEQGAKYGDEDCQGTLSDIYLEGYYNVPVDTLKGREYLFMLFKDSTMVERNMRAYRKRKKSEK